MFDSNYIYQYSDGTYSWSPDGEGRIWFDSLDEARWAVGPLPIRNTDRD